MELKPSNGASSPRSFILLIVPYGIETVQELSYRRSQDLLIVPYGIETDLGMSRIALSRSFNRTLWN